MQLSANPLSSLLKSNQTSFFDSPSAMQSTNEYQLLPLTPLTASSSGSRGARGSAEKAVRNAEKQRELATAALDSVNKVFRDNSTTKKHNADVETPYARVSPGHFLLHRGGMRPALGLGSPLPTPSPSGSKPSSISRRSYSVELRSSGAKMPPSRLGFPTPSGAPSPAGGGPSSSAMVPSPAPTSGAGSTSRKLADLQRRHSQLLEDCEAAERAATQAAEQRRRSQAEVESAARRVQELQTTITLHEKQVGELRNEHRERASQLEEMAQLLAERLEQAAEASVVLSDAQTAASAAKQELSSILLEVQAARAERERLSQQLQELQCSGQDAQALLEALNALQCQVCESTTHLGNLLQQQSAAEQAAADAEARRDNAEKEAIQITQAAAQQQDTALTATALSAEVEALLDEKEARAAAAQREWEMYEEGLAAASTELVEVSARLDARRAMLSEAEGRLEATLRRLEGDGIAVVEAAAAREAAEFELKAVQLRLSIAQAEENIALEKCSAAEERAMAATQHADVEEARVADLRIAAQQLEEQVYSSQQAEQRLKQLKEQIGELESADVLHSQLQIIAEENKHLRDTLEQADASADAAVGLSYELADAKSQTLAAMMDLQRAEGSLDAEREGRAEAENRCRKAEQALGAALSEVDRLTHHHHSITDVRMLEAQLEDINLRLSEASSKAECAENERSAAESQIALVEKERDAALDKAAALAAAQDASARELAGLRAELAHRQSMVEELRDHSTQMNRVVRSLKEERRESGNLVETLQLQIDSLQERLKTEITRRVVASTAESGSRNNKEAVEEVERRAAVLSAQNSALKATATKLSRALAAAFRQTQRGGGKLGSYENNDGLISAVYGGKVGSWVEEEEKEEGGAFCCEGDGGRSLDAVLDHLSAVESLLN